MSTNNSPHDVAEAHAYKTAYRELLFQKQSLEASRDENCATVLRLRDQVWALRDALRKIEAELDPCGHKHYELIANILKEADSE